MAQDYTIYISNQSLNNHRFWLFLKPPVVLETDPNVFANSSAYLDIDSKAPSLNSFAIPLQYRVGAGASNKAVGLGVKISSSSSRDAELGQSYKASYQAPRKGPTLESAGEATSGNIIQLVSNEFNQELYEEEGWYANMSYGIQSADGFIGMTWSPVPGNTRSIAPEFSFFISTGSFDQNSLARWTDVSTHAATIKLEYFKQYSCTVILTSSGSWDIKPGRPTEVISAEAFRTLVSSHQSLCKSHENLVTLANSIAPQIEDKKPHAQLDTVTDVEWADSNTDSKSNLFVLLKGKLSVKYALGAGLTFFILSGIRFQLKTQSTSGQTQFDFEYNGSQSASEIKELLKVGSEIELH